jgi:membrane-bound lytic murein transglycosylase A
MIRTGNLWPPETDGRAPEAAAEIMVLRYADLAGWADDDHRAALLAFRRTSGLIGGEVWSRARVAVDSIPDDAALARHFFETFFQLDSAEPQPALLTGYYEPEFAGSMTPTRRFAWPIYRMPPEIAPDTPWHSRAVIEGQNVLDGRGLELVWLEDPVDVYFLMVQGSGRIRLESGGLLRVGFAGRNGQPYKSIGAELIRRGMFGVDEMSAQAIRVWIGAHPAEGVALMRENPSYVFFRFLSGLAGADGPIGTMGAPLTAMRSIAVDPGRVPLGAPVWIETDGETPLRRLMIAQDTGSAITGASRGDVFFGSGTEAGEIAGRFRSGGRMVTLLPRTPDQAAKA